MWILDHRDGERSELQVPLSTRVRDWEFWWRFSRKFYKTCRWTKSSVNSPKELWLMRWRRHIKNAIEFMEQSHTAAANALKELKKNTPVIPHGPFRLLLLALCQPVIKLWGCHIRQVKREAPEGHTILCMTLSPAASMNLPTSVKTFFSCSPRVPHENQTWHQLHPSTAQLRYSMCQRKS